MGVQFNCTLLAVLLGLAASFAPVQDKAPSGKQLEILVAEYYANDWKTSEGMTRQDEIMTELRLVAPLGDKARKSWDKKLAKLWKKGPKLKKKGRNYLWEDEKRGLYIIGGKGGKPAGLFIGMHGGGVGSGDAGNSHGAWSGPAAGQKWLGIFPEVIKKTEHGWTDSGTEEFVIELVERARRTWNIDADHVFFGGHSMGGYGTWTLGAHHADMVAALTPSAGAPTAVREVPGGPIVDVARGVVANLRNVPMVIYQSDDDVQVPPDVNRVAVQKLAEAKERWGGFNYEYWEVEGRGHSLPPGGAKSLLEKVSMHTREPHPSRIVWEPVLTWKRQFYWLWWDEPELETLVLADLNRETNTIDVTLEGDPGGLYVLLSDELVDMNREIIVRLNGDETFRGVPTRSLAVLVSTARRGDARLTFDARVPVSK